MKIHFIKRNLLAAALCLLPLVSMAQNVFDKFEHLDRFDDVITSKQVKTLITKTDSTFVVETKGQKPVVYGYVDNPLMATHLGRRDSLVNLVADVYGYEDEYFAVTEEISNKVIAETQQDLEKLPDSFVDSLAVDGNINVLVGLRLLRKVKEMPTITVRTISRYEHRFEYKTDLIWIKFPDGSRYIYSKY